MSTEMEEINDPNVTEIIDISTLRSDPSMPILKTFENGDTETVPNEDDTSNRVSLLQKKSPLLTSQGNYFDEIDSLTSSQIVKPVDDNLIRRKSTIAQFVEQKQASIFSSMMNLSNTILGAGLLGLPYAIAKTGYFLSLILFIVMAILSFIGLHLSCSAALLKAPNSSYATLSEMSVPRAKILVDFAVAVKFCSCFCFYFLYNILFIISCLSQKVFWCWYIILCGNR